MPKIVIDPITRIEGHLRIEAQVEGGKVVDAWISGTAFRGMEVILKGRDPREAWLFAQRICGVCTMVHAQASVVAVEDALDIRIPDSARIIRNIIAASQHVQDHVIHFYHLHALDWVDVVSALEADPVATSQLAESISDWPKSGPAYFRGVQKRLRQFVDSGQLGIFANGYWGHAAYKLPPEANLMAVAHYLEALDWQRDIIRVHAVLGGKNPHLQTYLVGGMAIPLDPDSHAAINMDRIAEMRGMMERARDFVRRVYIPDLLAVASFYKDWAGIGQGVGNYLAYGEFPTDTSGDPTRLFLPRGIIRNRDLSTVEPVEHERITEYVTHSWYEYAEGDQAAKHPWDGETRPRYTGPKPPYQFLETDRKYSWLKAPRYEDRPMEVGPLARMLVAYASGHQQVRGLVDGLLQKLNVGAQALFSTLGRVAARGIETALLADQVIPWLDELTTNLRRGQLQIHEGKKWSPDSWPKEAQGVGFHEAPRGALGHWVRIKNERIENYQCVVPSTWNLSPRDAKGERGPLEEALVGTPVADPERPLEILRTVHSFDPCLACAVHVVDARGRAITEVQAI